MKRETCSQKDAAAVDTEVKEILRNKYNVKEGDVITMRVLIADIKDAERKKYKRVQMRVQELHKYFIVLINSKGFRECFQWCDYEKQRID